MAEVPRVPTAYPLFPSDDDPELQGSEFVDNLWQQQVQQMQQPQPPMAPQPMQQPQMGMQQPMQQPAMGMQPDPAQQWQQNQQGMFMGQPQEPQMGLTPGATVPGPYSQPKSGMLAKFLRERGMDSSQLAQIASIGLTGVTDPALMQQQYNQRTQLQQQQQAIEQRGDIAKQTQQWREEDRRTRLQEMQERRYNTQQDRFLRESAKVINDLSEIGAYQDYIMQHGPINDFNDVKRARQFFGVRQEPFARGQRRDKYLIAYSKRKVPLGKYEDAPEVREQKLRQYMKGSEFEDDEDTYSQLEHVNDYMIMLDKRKLALENSLQRVRELARRAQGPTAKLIKDKIDELQWKQKQIYKATELNPMVKSYGLYSDWAGGLIQQYQQLENEINRLYDEGAMALGEGSPHAARAGDGAAAYPGQPAPGDQEPPEESEALTADEIQMWQNFINMGPPRESGRRQ